MTDRLPRIPPEALRDVATRQRVARVWERLELAVAEPARPLRTRARSWAPVAVAAASLLAVGFGAGWAARGDRVVRDVVTTGAAPELPAAAANSPSASATVRDSSPLRPPLAPRHDPRPRFVTAPSPLVMPSVMATPAPVASSVPAWQSRYADGDLDEAFAALGGVDGLDAAINAGTPEQLMMLAQVARAAGEPSRAIACWRRVLEQFRSSRSAPLAAASLANVLAQAGKVDGAVSAWEAYVALSPGGEFAEDGLTYLAEAALARKDAAGCARYLEQLEQRFPGSPQLAELRARQRALGAVQPGPAGVGSSAPSGSSSAG